MSSQATWSMGYLVLSFTFSFVLLVLTFGFPSKASYDITCNSNDLRALTNFSNCLESAIPGWNTSVFPNCCTWTGVTCDESDDSIDVGRRVISLDLSRQRLSGNICESLSGLNQLRFMNLSHNFFNGYLPHYLFQLENLEVIDLSNNKLTGSVNGDACTTRSRVLVLKLSSNYFSGEIPRYLGNCNFLQHLSLDGNSFSGSFPNSIFQLRNLSELYLQSNRFHGSLDGGLRNLSSLVKVDISTNSFSGVLPDVFGNLTRLEYFSAESNRFTGQLPASLMNSMSLQMLNLKNNSISGSIYVNCSSMTNLISLSLSSNKFHGPLPVNMSLCPRLKALNVANNNLGGQIPVDFKDFQSLTHLSLSRTALHNLTAALEVLQHCRNLSFLVLTMNFYNEEMPGGLNLHFRSLKVLVLANSQIKGKIPPWLSRCKLLQLLDLSWNKLSGSIPPWFGSFDNLYYLDLSNNSLIGIIPEGLTNLLTLQSGNVSLQETYPGFPLYSNVNTRGASGLRLTYYKISNFRPSLLLCYNMLEGPISPTFGKLRRLHVMDLKVNRLSGHIPPQLSEMTMLETLDLSHNELSGEIPNSLLELSFLSLFNLSYNHLHGLIPTGGQFDTFPLTSFDGNKGLYRAHSSPPSSKPSPTPEQDSSERLEIIGWPFEVGAAIGFVVSVMICFLSGKLFPVAKK